MSYRTPTAIEHHGDAKRLSIAIGGFVVELSADGRVLTYYDTWRAARTDTDREFEHLLAEHPETIRLYLADVSARDYAATVPVVRTLLRRLPAAWADMVTAELLRAFRTVHYHDRTRADRPPATPPAAPPAFGVAVQLPPTHARGRVPQDPDPVLRNLRWLCRAYVPERPVSKHQLAREHAAATSRDPEDCLRDVKDGIGQAWGLLALAAQSDWSPAGRIVVPAKKDGGDH